MEHNVAAGSFELPPIRVNQVGYSPDAVKKAALLTDDASFEVVSTATGEVVFRGTASEPVFSESAGDMVRTADFSGFAGAGRFYIRNREGESYQFDIREEPYAELMRAVLDFYEYQKCGAAADLGIWSYNACHLSPAVIWGTDKTMDVPGGWHDAGDYGRYIVPSAKAVTDLLLAQVLTSSTHDDLLDIVCYQLEWMLKMQDPATGGVFHKVTTAHFPEDIMPDEDLAPLYLSPMSATASGGFAASLAFASRVYRDVAPAFADEMLAAAEKAWIWLDSNRFHPEFKNPEGITTGEYGDTSSQDERLWAACELYSATGKDGYHEYILSAEPDERTSFGLGWSNMGSYAGIAYLLMPESLTDPAMRSAMEKNILDNCERLMGFYRKEPYAVSMGMNYLWGSNMIAANNAVLLMFGDRLSPNEEYRAAATDHLHYLLGRNALSQSFITGFGTRVPMHPHHRPSQAARAPVPGMVAGGPDGNLRDPFLAEWFKGYPPAKCYADSDQSYASNEVAIYWNSPVYLLLALLTDG